MAQEETDGMNHKGPAGPLRGHKEHEGPSRFVRALRPAGVRGPRTFRAVHARRGFTLLELIVVLVVISLLLAMAAPRLRGFFQSRGTADAAQNLLSLMHWARSDAQAMGRYCRLNVDPQAGTFWLTAQEGGSFVRLPNDVGQQFSLPAGATIDVQTPTTDSNLECVQFDPSGRCDQAVIHIQGPGGQTYVIDCPSATEAYRIHSPSDKVANVQ